MDSDYDTSVVDDNTEDTDSASDVVPQSPEQVAHLTGPAWIGKPSRDSFSSLPTFILTDAMLECLVFRTGKQFYPFKEAFLLKKSFGDIFSLTNGFHMSYVALLCLQPYFGQKAQIRDLLLQFSPLDDTITVDRTATYDFVLQYGLKSIPITESGDRHSQLERFCMYQIVRNLQIDELL
jgi:hypothetical protein